MSASLPARNPQGTTTVQVVGGESLFALASRILGDPWQWSRIADLNSVPGIPPDFIVADAGTLLLPAIKP